MTIAATARVLEIIAILASWIAAAWLFRRIPAQRGHSISRHGGTTRTTYLVFGVTLTLYALIFLLFSVSWIIPHLHSSSMFTIFMVAGVSTLLLTAWIREGTNPRLHVWHIVVAYTMAVTMQLMLIALISSSYLGPISQAVIWTSILAMTIFWMIFVFVKSSHATFCGTSQPTSSAFNSACWQLP